MKACYYDHLSSSIKSREVLIYTRGVISTMPHVHFEPEIVIVWEGTLHVNIGSQQHTVSEGGMFFVDALTSHAYSSESGICLCTFIALRRDFLSRKLPQALTGIDFVVPDQYHEFPRIRQIRALFLAAYSRSLFETSSQDLFAEACVYMALEMISSGVDRNKSGISHADEDTDRIRAIAAYIWKNYRNNISIQTLAEHLHLSPDYMAHYFKSAFQTSFKHYLTYIRIVCAQQMMLQDTNLTITEVAEQCGFSSSNTFTRCFKSFCDYTPSEYRASARNTSCIPATSLLLDNPYSFKSLPDQGIYRTYSGVYVSLSNKYHREVIDRLIPALSRSKAIDSRFYNIMTATEAENAPALTHSISESSGT